MAEYPYLAKHKTTDIVVLFLSPKTGIRLSGEGLGYFSTKWKQDAFEKCPAEFSLILSNNG